MQLRKKIPFFDLNRQYEMIKDKVNVAVYDVLCSGQFIEGPAVKELEKKLGEYLGVKHVITCGNGTDALRIALMANGVGEGDEVIVTAFSFFATAEAIAQVGAIPVFVDISPDDFNMCVSDLREKISDKTKAILPVHIFGMPADMDGINKIAVEYGIPVLEDACQAIGAVYKGKKAGALGTIGCFSFYPTKNLGAFGDGGMMATNDDKLANACRAIKSHASGKTGWRTYVDLYDPAAGELEQWNGESGSDNLYDPFKYYNYFIGCNSRLDSIQAAALLVKLNYLDKLNEKRNKIADAYAKGLAGLPLQIPQSAPQNNYSCWHQYAILCDKKQELIQYLADHGIGAGNFYPVPLHLQKAFQYLGYSE